MAITRLQLPREMYASGELVAGAPSIKYEGDMRPEMDIRQPYGLGSFVKKIGRGIKKVVDNPIVQTALMMNPATAPYAAAYSGLRSGNPIGAMMAMQGMGGPSVGTGIMGGGIGGGMNNSDLILRSVAQNVGNTQAKAKKDMTTDEAYTGSDGIFGKVRDALFYKKGTQQLDPLKIALGAGAGLLGIGALQKRANEKEVKLADMIGDRGSKIGLDDIQLKVQAAIDSGDKATYENLKVTENLAFLPPWESIQKAEGGRIGYAAGGQTSAEMLQVIEKLRAEGKTELEIQQILKQMFQNRMSLPGGMMQPSQSGPASFIDTVIRETGAGGTMPRTTDIASIRESVPMMETASTTSPLAKNMGMMGAMRRADPRRSEEFMQEQTQPLPEISPYGAAQGGRIGYAIGDVVEEVEEVEQRPMDQMQEIEGQMAGPQWWWDRVQHLEYLGYSHEEAGQIAMDSSAYYDIVGYPGDFAQGGRAGAAEGGIMNMGGNEMDLRGGGFVPIGAQEKADDVPARLSKNEFVFTADAVRAAGGGDVDRGADKMYRTMKQLESRVG